MRQDTNAPPPTAAAQKLNLVFIGLTLSSSWGNGHATTYRGLLHALHERGHRLLFLERDVPWYSGHHRDLPDPDFCELAFYNTLEDLRSHEERLARADAIIIGSYVPDAQEVIQLARSASPGCLAFYDIDTPLTLDSLDRGTCEYLKPEQIRTFDLYLSFSGGRALEILENKYHAARARHLPCAVDPRLYQPVTAEKTHALGYLGTYSSDRQPTLEKLLLEPARRCPEERFVVAGPQYPDEVVWPPNVEHVDHLPPASHGPFYGHQRLTLNVTRDAMKRLGHSPSVRLFEAASCATAILSDSWPGIEDYFEPGKEILLCDSTDEAVRIIRELSEEDARAIGEAARARVTREHAPAHRAAALEAFLGECALQSGRTGVSTHFEKNS